MAVNKYTFNISTKDPTIQLGFATTFDEAGREDLIKGYEDDVVRKLINPTKDYEVTRFRHAPLSNNSEESPDIFYQFNFDDPTNPGTWPILLPPPAPLPTTPFGYNFQGYSNLEIAQNTSDLQKSFFKLDFYDSPNRTRQKFYMSSILAPVKGSRMDVVSIDLDCDTVAGGPWGLLGLPEPDVPITIDFDFNSDGIIDQTVIIYETAREIVYPWFRFDMDVNNNGYFFYWLKGNKIVSITNFFMSCKFYNGRDGTITRFTNVIPTSIPNSLSFNPSVFLYYRLKIDKRNFTYWLEDLQGNRVGTTINTPIQFWEYVNPV